MIDTVANLLKRLGVRISGKGRTKRLRNRDEKLRARLDNYGRLGKDKGKLLCKKKRRVFLRKKGGTVKSTIVNEEVFNQR